MNKEHLGWSSTVMLFYIGIPAEAMQLTRRSWPEYGISSAEWRTNLGIGIVDHSRATTNSAISSDCSARPMNCCTLARMASRRAAAGCPAFSRATASSRWSR